MPTTERWCLSHWISQSRRLLGVPTLSCAFALGAASTLQPLQAQQPTHVIQATDELVWSIDPPQGGFSLGTAWKSKVAADGTLNLGSYGTVRVAGLTIDQARGVIATQIRLRSRTPSAGAEGQTPAAVKAGDIVTWSVEVTPGPTPRTVSGKAAVEGDGSLNLGQYGSVAVAGLTVEAIRGVIERRVLDGQPPTLAQLAAAKPLENPIRPVSHQEPAPRETAPPSPPSPPSPPDRKFYLPQAAPSAPERTPGTPAGETPVAPSKPADSKMPVLPPPGAASSRQSGDWRSQAPGAVTPPPVPGTVTSLAPGRCPAPQECGKIALPPYVIEAPDILLVESTQGLRDQPIRGQHLVRPDGTIGLGIYGSVYVAGMTLDQARDAIAQLVALRVKDLDVRNLYVDVLTYNSKAYYVITDGGGYGEQVYRLPVTGSETVLDAISQINGLPPVASKNHIWIARPCCAPGGGYSQQILPVNWVAITQCGIPATNYQVLPGDRIYVKADHWVTFEAQVGKFLAPFERILGVTLLGSETVNSIRLKNNGATGNNGLLR